jgi:hypothetical protein
MVAQRHQVFNLSLEEGDAYFPSMCYFVETLTTAFARPRAIGAGVEVAAR